MAGVYTIRGMFMARKKKGIVGRDHETDFDCDKLVELQVFSEPGKVYREAITIIRLADTVMRNRQTRKHTTPSLDLSHLFLHCSHLFVF